MAWIWTIVGSGGAVCIMLAYILVSAKVISPESRAYHLLNFLGAAALAVSFLFRLAIDGLILNLFWMTVALVWLIKGLIKRKK